MPDTTFVIIGFEVIAIIIVLILYVIEFRKDKRLHEQNELPILEKLREKNDKTLQIAIEKSQVIIEHAQAESARMITDSNLKALNLEDKLKEDLATFDRNLRKTLTTETQKAIASYQQYLADLQHQTQDTQIDVETAAKQKVNEFIERFEQNLSDFLVQSQQKSLSAIELELASARSLIETYKNQQIKIINENILAMLEKTLSLVLNKKLSLSEHMDLIYESIEKAKEEKFIV